MLWVQTYSGRGDSGSGNFTMQYQLEGDPERAAALCEAVLYIGNAQRSRGATFVVRESGGST